MAKITTKQHLNDLRQKSVSELLGVNENSRAELFALKFQAAMGSLDKTHRISQLKKEIARIELILGEKRQAGEKVDRNVKGEYSKAVIAADKAGKAVRKKQLEKYAALNPEMALDLPEAPSEKTTTNTETKLTTKKTKTSPKSNRKVKGENE